MKNELSRAAASANVTAAVVCRVFYGLMVDDYRVYNGAWLSALLGAALSLPALWLIDAAIKRGYEKPLAVMLLTALIPDAAKALECAAFSESCLAFTHAPVTLLTLPLLLAAWRCAALGGDALGASARVWMLAFIPLFLVILIGQWSCFRPAWVAPVLGFGLGGILRAALRVAFWIVVLAGSAMALCGQGVRLGKVCQQIGLAAVVATFLILLRLMLTPSMAMEGMTRRVMLDGLLTNGRSPLYLQLPMITIWFVAMLHLLCYEVWAAQALFRRLWRKGGVSACAT